MATTTPNYGWPVPTSSDLVKNGATAIEALGDSIDASIVDLKGGTTGQVLVKASNTDMDFSWEAKKVLQVVSTAKTDTFTTTSLSLVDVTGLSVSITPTSASSKILVFLNVQYGINQSVGQTYLQLLRDSTAIALGDAAGSRSRTTAQGGPAATYLMENYSLAFLDSPATTSATTYKLQARTTSGSSATCINRSADDTDSAVYPRGISTIIVMEVTA